MTSFCFLYGSSWSTQQSALKLCWPPYLSIPLLGGSHLPPSPSTHIKMNMPPSRRHTNSLQKTRCRSRASLVEARIDTWGSSSRPNSMPASYMPPLCAHLTQDKWQLSQNGFCQVRSSSLSYDKSRHAVCKISARWWTPPSRTNCWPYS